MTKRAVAISLKIPDNTAFTALVALRRLGVDVNRIERSEIWLHFGDDDARLAARVMADERVFNPNKHRLNILEKPEPRPGEVWIVPQMRLGAEPAAIAWRLFDEKGEPVSRALLDAAVERLLCNPAIDRAVTTGNEIDRDIPVASE
jgi:phosphoribosylformylglycinamidine (FGAM) synthase PurS component